MAMLTYYSDLFDKAKLMHGVFDDFYYFVTGDQWTDTSGDTGASCAVSDGVKGIMTLTTGATDNNEAYLHSTVETFKFANGKPIVFACYMDLTEANTDDANIFMGLMDATAANALVDNGAGPKTTASGMGFEKRDGETEWRAWSSKSTTQTSTLLEAENKNNLSGTDQTAHSNGTYKEFRVEFDPKDATYAEINFYIDGVHVAQHQNFDYTSGTDMEVALGVKAGDANSETPTWDWVGCYQKR